MKKVVSVTLLSGLVCLLSFSQQDPKAKEILDRVSKKNKHYTTIQADFELTITNRREDFSSSNVGSIKIKGEKYFMKSAGTDVYFDGTTLWTHMTDINEVSLSEPDKSSGDFIDNPARIFDFYARDFKYKLVGETKLEGGWMYEIDLFPINLEQPYSRFKIFITRDTEELYKVSAIGKDGIDYTAVLKNSVFNASLDDVIFTFSPEEHKGIEVIDLRF